jgi:acetyl-CoA C-acetyltransferase
MPASTTPRATAPRTTTTPAPDASPNLSGARSAPRRAAILGGNRIPFARANGAYAKASNQDMLTTALEGLVARFGLAGE